MTDVVTIWSESLDSLAALVDRQRRHVAGEGSAVTDEWVPPAEPLPAVLRPRAILLRHETDELSAEIRRRLHSAPDARVSPYA